MSLAGASMTADAAAGREAPTHAPDEWFFIAGCQRSGTTLVRLILEGHSRIQCCDERVTYAAISGREPWPRRERPRLGLKIPCLTEQLGDASLCDWFVMPEVPNVYRGQPVLFIVRDVCDTIASMLALRQQDGPWLDVRLRPCFRAKTRRNPEFRRRYATELAAVPRARDPRLARAALYWRYKVDALFDYLDRGLPVLPVRYEDLVRHPRLELLRVCGFLQVPWEAALLQHEALSHRELNADGLATGGTDPHRPVDTQSVGRSRGVFEPAQVEEILHFAGDAQRHLYPEASA